MSTLMSLSFPRNFCRVLQISTKHSKISQYKSCLVFQGTQLCFWIALQILCGKWRKTRSTADFTIHQRHEKPGLCSTFLLKPLNKTRVGLCESCRGVEDLQLCYSPFGALLFKYFETLVVK
jgi:hypothetical protein